MKVTKSKVKKFLYSLGPREYIDFMKDIHFHCPFKTKELTDEVIYSWKTDQSMKSKEFNGIVEKREEERLQEVRKKRQLDLCRIQNLKSKTGLTPLQRFPKDIWMAILNQVLPEDRRNFRQVHKSFRKWTEKTLIGDILLPMIVGFKVERFWGDDEDEAESSDEDEDDNDNIPEKLLSCPLAQYSELRCVSKSLRNAVDRWYEEDLITNLRSGIKKSLPSRVICFNLNEIDDFRRIKKMKQDLSDPNSPIPQRFFTRSLSLFSKEEISEWRFEDDNGAQDGWDDKRTQLVEFTENIDEILDHIGDQIWYFSFGFQSTYWHRRGSPKFTRRYTSFLGWLQRMPNLKWLRIWLDPHEKDYKYQYSFPEGLLPPTMSHLERLDLELTGTESAYVIPVYYQFLRANSHVKILNLSGLKYVLKERNGFIGPNAKTSLALEVLNLDGWTYTPTGRNRLWSMKESDEEDSEVDEYHNEDKDEFNDIILIDSIIKTKWPLRQIDWRLGEGTMCIYSIFRALVKLPTLESVRLHIQDIRIRDDIAFLKLPQLTHFELKFDDPIFGSADGDMNFSFFFCLQFLLHAKKLKSLVWKCDMEEIAWAQVRHDVEEVDQLGQMIEFEGGLCEIKESNIWRVFPWLDTVRLELTIWEDRIMRRVKTTISEEHRRRDIDFY